ncbi:putative sensor domain DACNV-containing protein [Thalassoroseus pseudoceratinae]|uniref:putative sensor domain DACNV-containing protein n=1 Tax=Thalassoroseus pseudoceratinae TaxID=2713176 RepID=UPI001423AD3C|nr:hypothetical protein [Thalassoroseus pseudoceratinae]
MKSFSHYPADMTRALLDRWEQQGFSRSLLPSRELCGRLLDTLYQASLLREEGNHVRCRVLIAEPEDFDEQLQSGGSRLHVLRFAQPTRLTPHELRKLSEAANFYRSLLAVSVIDDEFFIWGQIVTGTDWVNRSESDRHRESLLPTRLVVQCLGAGHLIAGCGDSRVLESANGKILTDGFDPFRSRWLPRRFQSFRTSLLRQLDEIAPPNSTTEICDSFVKDVAQSVIRQTLRLVRENGHGGMLIYLPREHESSVPLDDWFRFRVRFREDDATQRFHRLMIRLMIRGREVGAAAGLQTVRWEDYGRLEDLELVALDQALIQFSHFLADLMSIDGSLVLDRGFRLIGFGAEILGDTPVREIHRALDLEAGQCVVEPADSGGTRHRSAYRLVAGIPDATVLVVSQDGDVRFVAHHKKQLTYWPYLP